MGNAPVSVQNHRYPSGNSYTGTLVGTKRHGTGSLTWPDGGRYDGFWKDDLCEGLGTMQFPNGSVYQGEFRRNNPYGSGTLTTINKEKLVGHWEYLGRSDRTREPCGKYMFKGELQDTYSGSVQPIHGPLALYLLSGLVTLPNMSDPMQALLPYAIAVNAEQVGTAEEAKKMQEENGKVPMAVAAAQAATSTSASIAFGKPEIAFQQRHQDDHASADLLDPRLYLNAVGITIANPANTNSQRQQQVRHQQADEFAQQQELAGMPVVDAVPVVTNPSQNQPIAFR